MRTRGWSSALVALGAAVLALAPVGCAQEQPAVARSIHLASRLVQAGPLPESSHPQLAAPDARRLARRALARIPLPEGGSFRSISWRSLDPPPGPGEIERLLQFNARCQWRIALAQDRQVAEASEVLLLVPGWSAFRDAEPPRDADLLLDCARSLG